MGLQGWNEEEVKEVVENYIREKLVEIDKENIEIIAMEVYGSRSYGGAIESSDLDIVVEFQGDIREDDFFSLLHDEDEPFEIEGIEVDINPITEEKSGTIEEYLERVKDFRKRVLGQEEVLKMNEMSRRLGENGIWFIIENYKGLAEHNFIATEEDLKKQFQIDDEMIEDIKKDKEFAVRGNITYLVYSCQTIDDLTQCMKGYYNDDLEDMIAKNYEYEGDYDGCYDDWYWDNELRMYGEEALDIVKDALLSHYKDVVEIELKGIGDYDFDRFEKVDLSDVSFLMNELGFANVERHWTSVTQGEAEVFVNGKSIVKFDDAMYLRQSNGSYTNGMRMLKSEDVDYFEENAGGWGSIQSDSHLIEMTLKRYPKVIENAFECKKEKSLQAIIDDCNESRKEEKKENSKGVHSRNNKEMEL